ncbi:MAG: hypothetical protein WB660_31830 [Candidatus Sulfotelmatobacter sp.]
MRTSFFTAVLTMTCLLGLGINAGAQDADKVTVTVPFAFVAGGTTLPAGEYTANRINPGVNRELAIRSFGQTGVFVIPMVFDNASAGQPKFTFDHIGGQYFLSTVETLEGVYTFGIPKAMVTLARVKDQGTVSPSGTK